MKDKEKLQVISVSDFKLTDFEYFTPVAKFRWFVREVKESVVYKETVLQQLHQGNGGTERWEDVETVYEN